MIRYVSRITSCNANLQDNVSCKYISTIFLATGATMHYNVKYKLVDSSVCHVESLRRSIFFKENELSEVGTVRYSYRTVLYGT